MKLCFHIFFTLEINFYFRKQEKVTQQVIVSTEVTLAESCVSLKTADQKVLRIGIGFTRHQNSIFIK